MAAKASKCGRLQLCTCATERSITRLRSGAEAGRTLCPQDSGQEELPHIRGQGKKLRVPGCDRAGAVERSYPMSEARGRGQEELPPARGQGRRPRQATTHPRSSGCMGTGGPRGAIPSSRSEEAAMRRYPSSRVKSRGCTLLEQP